jgi:hypothetical protein
LRESRYRSVGRRFNRNATPILIYCFGLFGGIGIQQFEKVTDAKLKQHQAIAPLKLLM